jgi:flavin reductase (DIM6/NTAB) family NADH-FMN oxidoreductase RutF
VGVGPSEYKDALRKFASGVTLVTVAADGDVHGMTASSFASVSLDPPLIVVSLEKGSRTREMVLASRRFIVNILSNDQEDIAHAFATVGHKSFESLPHRLGQDGAPLIDGAIAWIECDVRDIVDGGDHDVVIAEVVACSTAEGSPLLYYNRDYRSLNSQ